MAKQDKKKVLTEKEFQKKVLEKVDEKQAKNYHFLMVGGNVPEISSEIINLVNKGKEEVAVFELTNAEMRFITNSRSQARAEETAVDYIKNPKNIEFAKNQCIEFHKIYFRIGEDEDVNEFIGGVMNKRKMKKLVNASWKQLDEALNNLDLFGMVEWMGDKKDNFRLAVDEDIIVSNKIKELEQILKFAGAKVIALKSDRTKMNEDSKKVLTRLTRNFNTDRNWNLNN